MNIKKYIKRVVRYLLTGLPEQHITAKIVKLSSNNLLEGRNALITGGTSGIGYAIADAFLSSGAFVTITGRNKQRLEDSYKKLLLSHPNCKERISFIVMDNKNISSFKNIFDQHQYLQNIDILVNNAGVQGGLISNTSEEEYDNILETNLKGPFFLSKLVAQNMKNNKIKGNILNIASSSSLRPGNSAYNLSKWGIRSLTLGLAKSLIPYGITVNGIAPGPTATPMLIKGEIKDITHNSLPTGRYAMPEEIANMAVILTSSMGHTVVGDIVYMTGGAGIITFDDVKYPF